MFKSTGILHYSINPYKLVLDADQDLSDYYRSLIPKYIKVNKQMYGAHISLVRNETPEKLSFWNKYEGKQISFTYENVIYNDSVYYWLNCYCEEFEFIRMELGLTKNSLVTKSPDGRHTFHMTLGNLKNK